MLVAWDGFGVGSRYAAMHPERVSALVLYEPFLVADDDWESWSAGRVQRGSANVRGEDDILAEVAPSRIADRKFRDWYARAGRLGASPSTAPRIWESVMRADPGWLSSSRSSPRRSCFTAATTCSRPTTC